MTTLSRPVTIIEIDLPICANVYGVAPCTAALAAGLECYQTLPNCQDTANFAGTATRTYRFTDNGIGLPPEVGAIPCVLSVSSAPTKLEPMKGLGKRASVTIRLSDFAHHDRGFDPYVATRSYIPEDRGTFWGKFRARHKYYQGRKLRVRTGTIASPWSWALFSTRSYIIERITGPDANGNVTITAKDILKLADGDRAQCPIASTSTLSADISAAATSLVLLPSGIGASEYALREQTVGSGYVRIGSEIMAYTRSSDTLTLTRGAWGTTAAAHSAADAVQLCASWSAVNVATVIKQLLGPLYADVDAANTGTSYLSDASWTSEALGGLAPYSITGIVSKPEGIDKLIGELCEQCIPLIWWDEANQLVKIKAIEPQLTVTDLTDDANLIMNSVQVSDDPAQRVSQVWFYYGKRDYTGDDKPENFRYLPIKADLSAEGTDQYGESKIRIIYSRWLTTAAPVNKTASRMVTFLRDNPRLIRFSVDSKDRAIEVASSALMTTKALPDASGAPVATGVLITERTERGGRVEYAAADMAFYGRYLRIAPGGSNASGTHVPSTYSATIADYTTATAEEKRLYGYIAPGGSNASGIHVPAAANTKFADGGEAYKIA